MFCYTDVNVRVRVRVRVGGGMRYLRTEKLRSLVRVRVRGGADKFPQDS